MNDKRLIVGSTAIIGLLIGVVIGSMTGDWWWIGVGFGGGIGVESLRNRDS